MTPTLAFDSAEVAATVARIERREESDRRKVDLEVAVERRQGERRSEPLQANRGRGHVVWATRAES
jgi:hypothetical protein